MRSGVSKEESLTVSWAFFVRDYVSEEVVYGSAKKQDES